ncbi:ABC transporter permease [Rhizobium sp. GN54]|uniref:ABC transporter permease n=1 Tax=Rhizobium sp. GN54 TaxID=2898150 RepID=UPI001E64E007|nr:ABC transporter permease [Rhizobium sp. GN54]
MPIRWRLPPSVDFQTDREARELTSITVQANAFSTLGGRKAAGFSFAVVLLPFLLYAAFFIAPVVLIAVQSLTPYVVGSNGGLSDAGGLTLDNYAGVFSPTFRSVFTDSLRNALAGSLLCLLIGYPVAYFISTRCSERLKPWFLVLVILPFWTSYLLRMLGWRILLGANGDISAVLQSLHLLAPGQGLLFTQAAVLLGLVYNFLPVMILPIYVSIERLSREHRDASRDLYARPWETFLSITLPLTYPGIMAGMTVVFIMMTGDYVTPELMGGAKGMMVGTLIYSQFLQGENWPLASAMSLSLVFVLVVAVLAMSAVGSGLQRLPTLFRRVTR